MKLGILIYSLGGGGAERVVSYLAPYIKDANIDIHLILMNTTIKLDIPKNIPIHYIEKSNPYESGIKKFIKIPYLAYKYSVLCKKLKLTHSFSLLTRPNYINIISKYFSSYNCQINISERAHPSLQYGYNNFQSKINRLLISILYPKADLIICNSSGNANDLILNFGVNKKKVVVIHNPIDLHKINSIEPIKNFYNPDYFNLVTIGRLDEGKNHKLLINTVKKISNVKLYILGEGYLQRELEELIVKSELQNKVYLLGFDSNPYKYLKAADLFIFGSNHEGFPNVLLEAMSCGLPILSTNCKSGPDEILLLKEPKTDNLMITPNGILTPINNVNLMTEGLQYFLNNPDYLSKCRINVSNRVKSFEKDRILENYKNNIFK